MKNLFTKEMVKKSEIFRKTAAAASALAIVLGVTMNAVLTIEAADGDVSADGIAIDETSFPDAAFRQYVSDNCDTDTNGYLSDSEIAAVTSVSVDYLNISDMKGIEYFTALTALNCSGNQLTALDVSKNTALTELYCYENPLTALDVSKNTELTKLDCYNNQLNELDVSKNTALTYLACENNQLAELDISQNNVLTYLSCHVNRLTALNVSQNTALIYLSCDKNQLTALDVRQNTALEELYCDKNQLTSLDLSENNSLTNFNCEDNIYTVIGSEVAIADLPGSFDPSKATNWTNAEVKDGKILSDGLCTVTYTYDCGNNNTETFSIEFSKNLIAIDETNFPDDTFRRYVSSEFDKDKNGYLSDGEIAAVTHIYVNYHGISDMTGIEYFTALTELQCIYNQLTALDVSKNTALAKLYCSGNQLTELDVSQNAALTELDCYGNQLTALDVSQSTALELLSCYSNQLTALNICKSTKLTYLDCSYNQLAALDVSQNTELETLNCYCNQLTALDVSQNAALTDKGCNLSDNKYIVCGSEVAIADIPGNFDSLKASDWTNAEVKDDKIISGGLCTATYTYDCGNDITATFSIEFIEHTGGTATCTQKAICDTCKEEYGDLAPHTLTKTEAVPATCTAAGNEAYWICSACGKMFSDESGTTEIKSIPTTPAFGHKYGTDWKSDADSHWHECTVCGDKIDSAAHTEDNGTVTKQPTASETGERTYKCTVCGNVIKTEIIPALGGGSGVPIEPTNPTRPTNPTKPVTPSDSTTADQSDEPETPSRPDNEVPFIKDENGKNGWDVIKGEISKAEGGSAVTVDMNGAAVVPGNIFNALKGKDVTVVFDLGGGITWSVNGRDVTSGKTPDIDFSVKAYTENIPVDVINNITGERYGIQISLAHNGEFGFTAVLSINLGSDNAGLKAALYYYNGGALELMCESEISADGTARLTFAHASDYLIVIGETETAEDGDSDAASSDNSDTAPSDDSDAAPSGDSDTVPSGDSDTASSGDSDTALSGDGNTLSGGEDSVSSGSDTASERDSNPSTGAAVSLMPFAAATAIAAAAKRKRK